MLTDLVSLGAYSGAEVREVREVVRRLNAFFARAETP